MNKLIAIIATGVIFYAGGYMLQVEGAFAQPLHAALWGATGTAALLYWPRRGTLQLISLCWLCVLLYGMAALAVAGCAEVRQEENLMPSAGSLLIFVSIPFLLVMVPLGVLFIRSMYRDHMRTLLEEAVLAATDPLDGPTEGAMAKAQELLARGTPVDYIADAMVERDELLFEAVDTPNPQAVANAIELLPQLAAAGATISQTSLDSARYNCPPSLLKELSKFPLSS